MRRQEREIKDPDVLQDVLSSCKVCRLAMQDEKGLYIVPMNFGYCDRQGQLTLYFHCAGVGRKISALQTNGQVCFEMDCSHALIEGEKACQYSYQYRSIIGTGQVLFLLDQEEKKDALCRIMQHQTGKQFSFTDQEAAAVTVFKIQVTEFTGKQYL